MKEEIIGLLKYCGTFNISKTNITTIEEYLDYITELGYIDVSIGDNEFEAVKLIVQDYIDLQTENAKLKQVISRAIELTNEIISQGYDYYEKDMTAYKLLDILEKLGE